jgi:hypothetical protein
VTTSETEKRSKFSIGDPEPGLSTTLINFPHNCNVFNLKYILNKIFVTANNANFFECGVVRGVL